MTLKSLLSASALIAFGMLAGRVLGLLREMLLAAQFGASGTADTAIILLIIPDFITAAFIGSAASAALIPAFAARSETAAHALYRQSLAITLAGFTIIALILGLTAALTGWNIPPTALILTLFALPLSAGTAILTAWLQYKSRFLIPAFATVIFNTVIILALLGGSPTLITLAAAITFASLARLAAHIASASKLPKIPQEKSGWQLDKSLTTTYATAMGTGLLGLLPTYIPYALIASTGTGVALFNYALKLILMPAMLLQTVAQMAVLPWLVSARKTRDETSLATLHAHTIQVSLILSFIAALSLALCAHALTTICFHYGKMTQPDIDAIAQSFAFGILAMPAMVATTLLQSILYAANLPRPAFIASLAQAILILPLMAAAHALGNIPGVMAAFALIQAVPVVFLLPACRRHALIPPASAFTPALRSLAAALIIFAPLALWLANCEFSPILTIACATVAGIVSLIPAALLYRNDTKNV